MPIFDFPLEELRNYLPDRNEPKDFDSFWQNTLTEARSFPLDATFEPVDYGIRTLETFDVTYRGFGGQAVKGWLVLPRQRSGKLACVVEYIGYGGGRGFPTEWMLWASLGYAHFVMDTRGQGGAWRHGETLLLRAWRGATRTAARAASWSVGCSGTWSALRAISGQYAPRIPGPRHRAR